MCKLSNFLAGVVWKLFSLIHAIHHSSCMKCNLVYSGFHIQLSTSFISQKLPHSVKTRLRHVGRVPPSFCFRRRNLRQADFLEYFAWYLQIARGWVWLILIKFNLFWWSIWKRPKRRLRRVCELSDEMAGLSITWASAPGVGTAPVSGAHWPACTLALTPGCSPNSYCHFIRFSPRQQVPLSAPTICV